MKRWSMATCDWKSKLALSLLDDEYLHKIKCYIIWISGKNNLSFVNKILGCHNWLLYAYYAVGWFTLHCQIGSNSREASWEFDRNARMEMEHEEGKENQPRVAFPTMWCWT